jgi:adenosylcobinamide-GDP ribazoletransferase
MMAVTARALPYVRPGGLASAFLGGPTVPAAIAGGVLATGLVLSGVGAPGAVAVAAVVAGAAAVAALARRRLGGFTGDVLGAGGMVGETAGLVVAAVRW